MADVKPNDSTEAKPKITITAQNQAGEQVQFQVKVTTKFKKVIDAYCEQKRITQRSALRFLCNGERIQDTDTPASLEMEDGDVIDVMVQQEGGGSSSSSSGI